MWWRNEWEGGSDIYITKEKLGFVQLWKLFFFPEGGVGLVPKRGCLLTLAYYAFPRRYEFGELQWNDILTGENRTTRKKTCPSATLSTSNPTWIYPGANPGLRGERPATNNLIHGTACRSCYSKCYCQEIDWLVTNSVVLQFFCNFCYKYWVIKHYCVIIYTIKTELPFLWAGRLMSALH
jgi:hypothetical protein